MLGLMLNVWLGLMLEYLASVGLMLSVWLGLMLEYLASARANVESLARANARVFG